MFENKIYEVVAGLDDTCCRFHQVRDMLFIYDECIDNDVRDLERSPELAPTFITRYDKLRSLSLAITENLCTAIEKLESQLKAGCALMKEVS